MTEHLATRCLPPEPAGVSGENRPVSLVRLARGGTHSRYQREGEVAAGGQGVIFKAWDEDLKRHLAMKVLHPAQVDAPEGESPGDMRSLGRFLEEVQVTGQLDHSGIVPVHEMGLDGEGNIYFTMNLVHGETLADAADRPVARALLALSRVDSGV